MNITEDYVSFEVAKLLKEKGFHEPCIATYNSTTKNFQVEEIYEDWTIHWKGYISVPTQQMAMKWLREVHKLHIGIARGPKGYHITIETIPLGVVKYITKEIVGTTYVNSYEKAVEAALKYCLEKIIK